MSKRKITIAVVVLAIAALAMILPGHVWVKNKTATVMIDERPAKMLLFHGTEGRLYLEGPSRVLVLQTAERCGEFSVKENEFIGFGPLRFSKHNPLKPGAMWECIRPNGEFKRPVCTKNSIEFSSCDGHNYRVVWRDPPG